MNYFIAGLSVVISTLCWVHAEEKCKIDCPENGEMTCGFAPSLTEYKMFPSPCALDSYVKCVNILYKPTPIEFCIKSHNNLKKNNRRDEGDPCPVFCPEYYMPVCGASKFRSYIYRTFNNACYLDMLNCRGEEESLGYEEVPLEYCQKHMMKNIFKEQVVFTGLRDYNDYE